MDLFLGRLLRHGVLKEYELEELFKRYADFMRDKPDELHRDIMTKDDSNIRETIRKELEIRRQKPSDSLMYESPPTQPSPDTIRQNERGEAADVQHFLLAAVKAIEHQNGYCRYPPMSLIAYMAPYSNSPSKSRPTQKYWTALTSRPHLRNCSNAIST